MTVQTGWRGQFDNDEVNRLHADAFGGRVYDAYEWDWEQLVAAHSLGWVTARDPAGELVGFVNVVWDGFVHAWVQDTMVASTRRSQGIGRELIRSATHAAREARCEWLHVDFDDHLQPFYYQACGFVPTKAGLIQL